jgi:hypothetical protein
MKFGKKYLLNELMIKEGKMKKLLTVLLITLIVSSGVAYAQGFTNESLQGTYTGITTNEGSNWVVFGTFTADGNGTWSGSAKGNLPGLFGQRIVMELTFSGTYTINDDGTATLTMTFTREDGLEGSTEIDGVIRESEIIDGVKIVTELIGFSRGGELPSLKPGSITTYDARRLSD